MTSSNLVGCSTGKSAGLAPLRILSTPQDARPLGLERRQKFGLRSTTIFWDRFQRKEQPTIGEVGSGPNQLIYIQRQSVLDQMACAFPAARFEIIWLFYCFSPLS